MRVSAKVSESLPMGRPKIMTKRLVRSTRVARGGLAVAADDQVTFPMTRNPTVLGVWVALVDRDHPSRSEPPSGGVCGPWGGVCGGCAWTARRCHDKRACLVASRQCAGRMASSADCCAACMRGAFHGLNAWNMPLPDATSHVICFGDRDCRKSARTRARSSRSAATLRG